ncbi:hypothetical protein FEM48_Zijuj02G0085100 [Ziziphus jujuba var. spinosa]|uniref:Uncharacterized protein n=1 Tax=Ziziphus jujuba var. spinosa TaxID=714518 RepID=A0A978VUP6_ZIZJJ|nr:hypothetical protein FEM48_Zijuj02G0085100 [Ziziphus jujuba var. spinosa]
MGFFDLNIPYLESSASDKSTRIKLATLAMELGYSGIAYNRTIKGVMSDRDRCSIPLFTLSSLLKLSSSLSSSVYFHRDLLGVPRDSPFRQYRRLTVCVDNLSQAQALNSGNHILKTYDFVAVKPMNQSVFDKACEKLEVDIIAIDFSEKLPFRLKLPMVKAAIERGVYFEITYSNLTADIQTRRQMISNAKLLVDWTRGKNLIISSAAPTVFELRGPYDIANLSSLLGLSMERAKAAMSKNCRCLITKALRKRQFYKEAIKVEMVSSGEQVGLDKPLSSDWLKWDPISSGEGDLMLDDIAKSFAACDEVSKAVKAIDFTSVVDSLPSHGFQVKDLISGANIGSQSQDSTSTVISSAKVIELPILVDGNLEQSDRPDLPVAGQTSLNDTPFENQTSGNQICQKLFFPSDTTKAFTDAAQIRSPSATTEAELSMPSKSDMNVDLIKAKIDDLQSQNGMDFCELRDELSSENITNMSGIELGAACDTDSKVESPTPIMCGDVPADYEDRTLQSSEAVLGRAGDPVDKFYPAVVTENLKDIVHDEDGNLQSSEIVLGSKGDPVDKDVGKVVTKNLKGTSLVLDDLSLHENFTETEQLEKPRVDPVKLLGQVPILEPNNVIRVGDNASDGNSEPPEVTMEEQKQEKADNEFNHQTPAQSVPGKSKAKRRIHHQAFLLPLKRMLSPIPFKKKAHKSRRKAS